MFVCMRVCVCMCLCITTQMKLYKFCNFAFYMALGVTVHSMEVHGLSNKVCYECSACHTRQGWRCIGHLFHRRIKEAFHHFNFTWKMHEVLQLYR